VHVYFKQGGSVPNCGLALTDSGNAFLEALMGLVRFLLVGVLLAGCASVWAAVCQHQAVDTFVVKVHTGGEVFASGVRINHQQVVTVLHALPVSGEVYVSLGDKQLKAELVDSHQAYDLALLTLGSEQIVPELTVYPRMLYRSLRQQESVWAAGFSPQGVRLREGVFLQQKLSGLLSSADIEGGFSGGPLLACHHGEWMVAGLLRSYRVHVRAQGQLQRRGISTATPATALVKFLFLSEPQWAATPH
jgi:S1-C subfamily serine protease